MYRELLAKYLFCSEKSFLYNIVDSEFFENPDVPAFQPPPHPPPNRDSLPGLGFSAFF
jgi:hypothetical protein